MSMELDIIKSSPLSEQEIQEINRNIDNLLAIYKNNHHEISQLVDASVSAMTDGEGYERELSNKKGIRRLIGGLTGSNKRLQDKINSSRAAAQYASQLMLNKIAAQNLLTADLVTAINEKLNSYMYRTDQEINQIYVVLIRFFNENKNLNARVTKLERSQKILIRVVACILLLIVIVCIPLFNSNYRNSLFSYIEPTMKFAQSPESLANVDNLMTQTAVPTTKEKEDYETNITIDESTNQNTTSHPDEVDELSAPFYTQDNGNSNQTENTEDTIASIGLNDKTEAGIITQNIPVNYSEGNQTTISTSGRYVIDSIAYNLTEFRSMVIDNAGVAYYINGDIIYNSSDTKTLSLLSDFDTPLTNAYLAYDPYHDIVYLLSGGTLKIHDITDLQAPTLVLDDTSCPNLLKADGGKLAYESYITPQIAVLKDGSILVPIDDAGTYRINPINNTVTRFSRLYNFSPPYFAKVIGNSIIKIREGSIQATIIPLSGGEEYDVELEETTPNNSELSVCSNNEFLFFFVEGRGFCQLDASGKLSVLISQNSIQIDDYQRLENMNIWCIDMNTSKQVVFYDNTLKCIRYLQPID